MYGFGERVFVTSRDHEGFLRVFEKISGIEYPELVFSGRRNEDFYPAIKRFKDEIMNKQLNQQT